MQHFTYGDPASDRVLIQPVDVHDLALIERETAAIAERTPGFFLIAVRIDDWNRDLSPWTAPPVCGSEPFGSGARDTLDAILPLCADRSRRYCIGGYSLAGLFALWAVHETDAFDAVAAAAPSMWFPGFSDYLRTHPIRAAHVYLSLGDREERTRNPVMATVGARMQEAHEYLCSCGADCVFEWNAGNHFKDPDLRTAKGFSWALERMKNGRG